MMKKGNKLHWMTGALYVLLIVVVTACGNRRHETVNSEKPERRSDKELQRALFAQQETPFYFFNSRVGVDFKNKDQDVSFSCYVKLKVDTAFSGSIKVAQIVFATYMVTTDSITFVNKREDCYFNETLEYVSSLFGTTITFDFFQDLILGHPIGLDESIKYQQINSDDHYILSSHKKKDYRKLENDRLNIEDDVMLIQYHLNGQDLNVDAIDIQIPSDTTSIRVDYTERKAVNDILVPEETSITIKHPTDTITIHLNYGTVKLNEPKKIGIKIPASYHECP